MHTCNPSAGVLSHADSQGSLLSQQILGEPQPVKDPVSKTKVDGVSAYLWLSIAFHMHVQMYSHVTPHKYTHMPTHT